MPNLILTRGIPGSGKDTWANGWIAQKPEFRARVNRDDIRAMLFGPDYSKPVYEAEKLVTKVEQDTARMLLGAGRDVVVSDTNLRAKFVRQWYAVDPDLSFQDFEVDFETAVARDAERGMHGGRQVGEDVIRDFWNGFTDKGKLPAPPRPLPVTKVEFPLYVPDESLPEAFIFDIDGTLAKMDGRGPYDTSLYHTDTIHTPVRNMLMDLYLRNYKIIITSGRSDEFRAVTEEWLLTHNVFFDELFMRAAGDQRNDAIVKAEILHRDIAPKYWVRGSFDDRDRVVAAWRAMGIKTYQVEPGAF